MAWKPNIMEGYFKIRSAWPTVIYITRRRRTKAKVTSKKVKG